jgi:FSR family fosmidomycin resistance protein-like MFS transporter
MSLWMLGGEVGFAVGPLLIVTWVNWLGLKGMPWLALIGVLGSILLLVRLRDVPRTAAPSAQGVPWWRAVSQMGPVMLPLLGLIVARSFALSALSSYLPTFLSEGGTSFWLAGASLTVYQVAASGGVLLGGSLSDRLGRRAILLASMALSPLFLFAFLRLGGAPQIASLLGIGFGVAFFDPVVLALVQETFTQNRALASSVYLSLMFVVRSFATVAVGAVGDWLGLRWAFTASAIVFLLGAPLVFWLPRASVAGQTASESGSRP